MNYFSHNPLNRFAEIRADASQIAQLWENNRARVLVVLDNLSLLTADAKATAMLPRAAAADLLQAAVVRVYLGSEGEVPYFALGFAKEQENEIAAYLPSGHAWHDLRQVALQLPKEQGALLAYARGMVHWHLHHRYCANCASPTTSEQAGHVRYCTNPACKRHHFPRTDTAVIVLISEGDTCLLGRQQVWPEGLYAVVAGFLEPGETLEQAVAREAMEETGVTLQRISYHSSQPWPFPGSIMVGFEALAANRTIQVDHVEMEDARWFTRDEIVAGLQDNTLRMPPQFSIAFRLIRDWFNAAGKYKLEDLVAAASA
ncbi:NAD(+) diphosphatase [Pontibacter akesuensis]|uniref:NAD(+) diphosphatase n=1 Tax=Pontibacter akesuensis TaxID=388950 RepID=A0A1I7KEH7_9BACT|nr:NAD(+) diphosphatase [Pontibacter akesuensis]GHA79849.1 NADH pyrophosphatase [Pontibacter akesuensis]SFU95794.1 NAD+ diphosphatase [Pontibacter akesuensis]